MVEAESPVFWYVVALAAGVAISVQPVDPSGDLSSKKSFIKLSTRRIKNGVRYPLWFGIFYFRFDAR